MMKRSRRKQVRKLWWWLDGDLTRPMSASMHRLFRWVVDTQGRL
jgi:hypothetical protein